MALSSGKGVRDRVLPVRKEPVSAAGGPQTSAYSAGRVPVGSEVGTGHGHHHPGHKHDHKMDHKAGKDDHKTSENAPAPKPKDAEPEKKP